MTVESLCERITSGGTPRRDDPSNYTPGVYPWVKTAELADADIMFAEELISARGLATSSAKLLPAGTVLMAMYGATVGMLGRLAIEASCNQASCAMVADPDRCDSRWLLYALKHRRVDIIQRANGAAQQNLNASSIKSFELSVPPVEEQQAIAAVLGALDDKIVANENVALTALALGEVLYARSVQHLESMPMSRALSPVLGGTPKRDVASYWDGPIPWVSVKDVSSSKAGSITRTLESISELGSAESRAKVVPAGSVILTARGTVGEVARLTIDAAFNQSCYAFVPGRMPPGVLFYSVRQAALSARQIAHGSVFSTITTQSMHALEVPAFPFDHVNRLEQEVSPLLALVDANLLENETLVALRDTLMPALMDGTIRVKDAVAAAEEVL